MSQPETWNLDVTACRVCKTALGKEWRYCPSCGHKLNGPQTWELGKVPEPKVESDKPSVVPCGGRSTIPRDKPCSKCGSLYCFPVVMVGTPLLAEALNARLAGKP